jgi:translation initiation factor 2 gamma subunit (eIF-2gamma)
LDPSLTKADSLTGCIVAHKNVLPEISYKAKIKYKLFGEISGTAEHQKTDPIKTKEMLMLSVNTTITVGTVEKLDDKMGEIELTLNIPIIALKGDNVGIARNIGGHWRLIGFGEILN